MSQLVRRVVLVGGTHGNELTGVYLVKKFQQFPDLLKRPTIEITTLLANPKAVEFNQRYIDRDLNRCFAEEDLANLDLTGYENKLAKEISAHLGPKDKPKVDMIIDLHSTTANMGLTILPSSKHPFNLQLAAYLSALNPSVRICFGEYYGRNSPLLRSLAPLGCTIEVGSVPQGVLDSYLFAETEILIHAILDYVDAYNQGQPLDTPSSLDVYQAVGSVDYPRTSRGELQAAIHPQLQFKDYQPLHPSEPIFLSFTGEVVCYQGESTVFPVFINESAYYEKHIAMVLTEKQLIEIE